MLAGPWKGRVERSASTSPARCAVLHKSAQSFDKATPRWSSMRNLMLRGAAPSPPELRDPPTGTSNGSVCPIKYQCHSSCGDHGSEPACCQAQWWPLRAQSRRTIRRAPRAARRSLQCWSANASGDVSSPTHQSLSIWSSAYDSASAVSANKPTTWKPFAGLPHIKIVVGIRRFIEPASCHPTCDS